MTEPLAKRILEDIKVAMRAKDVVTRDTLRMIKSQLGEAELAKGAALDESDELKVLARAVKSREESAVQYEEAGRAELAEKERAEIVVVQRYLPQQLSEDEAKAAIGALAEKLGITEKKQMGQLMKAVMAEFRGQIDGKLASKLAGQVLS